MTPSQRGIALGLALCACLILGIGAVVVLSDPAVAPPAGPRVPVAAPPQKDAPAVEPARHPADAQPGADALADLPPPAPILADAGRVFGTVTRGALGDEPLAGARVVVLHATGEHVAEASTDHAGRYSFEGLPEDTPLALRLSAAGCLGGVCCDVRPSRGIAVRRDVAMWPAPSVVVRLRRMPWERGAARVPVLLRGPSGQEVRAETDQGGEATLAVDELGEFRLQLGGGEYAVLPEETLVLSQGPDLRVERDVFDGGGVEVHVRLPNGEPAVSAGVVLTAPGVPAVTLLTDATGRAEANALAPELRFRVVAETDAGRLRAAGESVVRDRYTDRLDLTLVAVPPLRGVVVDWDEVALGGARVVIETRDGVRVAEIATTERGEFELEGPPEPPLRLRAVAAGHTATVVEWGGGGAAPLVVRLGRAPTGTVRGRVVDEAGAPLSGVRVRALPARRAALSDENGRFEFGGLPEGIDVVLVARVPRMRQAGPERGGLARVRVGSGSAVLVMLRDEADDGGDAAAPRTPPGERRHGGVAWALGRVVDSRGAPVARAVLRSAAGECVSDGAGAFRLPYREPEEGVLEFDVTPPPGLLLPRRVAVDVGDDAGAARTHLDDIALVRRAFALVRIQTASEQAALHVTCASSAGDEALGARVAQSAWREGRTYDGTWLCVPPLTDEHEPPDALDFACAVLGPRGAIVGAAQWSPRREPDAELTVKLARTECTLQLDGSRVRRGRRLVFEQTQPLAERGAALPIAFTPSPAPRFEVELPADRREARIDGVAFGIWTVRFESAAGDRQQQALELRVTKISQTLDLAEVENVRPRKR